MTAISKVQIYRIDLYLITTLIRQEGGEAIISAYIGKEGVLWYMEE